MYECGCVYECGCMSVGVGVYNCILRTVQCTCVCVAACMLFVSEFP